MNGPITALQKLDYDWSVHKFIEVNFSKLTDNSQIFRNDFDCIHYHLCKISSQIIECKISALYDFLHFLYKYCFIRRYKMWHLQCLKYRCPVVNWDTVHWTCRMNFIKLFTAGHFDKTLPSVFWKKSLSDGIKRDLKAAIIYNMQLILIDRKLLSWRK